MATKKPMKKFKRYDVGGEVATDEPMTRRIRFNDDGTRTQSFGEQVASRQKMGGDEAALKQQGLEISNRQDPKPSGFLDRIKSDFSRLGEGSIDTPGSEAYNKYGAGRARAAAPVSVTRPQVVARPPNMQPRPVETDLSDDMYSDTGSKTGRGSAGTSETSSAPERGAPGTSETVKPTRQQKKPEAAAPRLRTEPSRGDLGNKPSQYAGPMRGMRSDAGTSPPVATHKGPRDEEKSAASKIPGQSTKAPEGGEKADSSETGRNIGNALMAVGAGGAAASAYKLKKMYDASKAAKKALLKNPRLERPGTVTGKDFVVRDYEGAAKAGSKGVPKKQLGYSKDTDVTDVMAKKRGGAVKKYASGGMVSSASKRADGIATKGKTRGKMC